MTGEQLTSGLEVKKSAYKRRLAMLLVDRNKFSKVHPMDVRGNFADSVLWNDQKIARLQNDTFIKVRMRRARLLLDI